MLNLNDGEHRYTTQTQKDLNVFVTLSNPGSAVREIHPPVAYHFQAQALLELF
jgi:hypothetical protein